MNKYILIIIVLLFSNYSYSLSIEDSVKSTIENNPKVKIAYEKLVESKELIEKALGAKLPTIKTTITGTYEKSESTTSTTSTTPETFTDSYKLSLTQNLYDAGYKDLEIERSKLLYNKEITNFNITIQNLILDAINGYLTVINYQKSLESTQQNYDAISKALNETKTRYNLGTSTLYDLQTAESLFAIASSNLYSATQNYELSKTTFERIVGEKPLNLDDIIDIETDLDFNRILSNTLDGNFDLKLLDYDLKNYNILLVKEKKTKHPNLDVTGSAEYTDGGRIDNGTETTKGSLSLTLTIPLYQQGIDNSNIRKYQSQILQAELNYEDLKSDIKIQLSNAFKDFNVSKSNMTSFLAVVKARETALRSLVEEYNIGTKTITDLAEEETKLLTANVDFFNSKKNYLVNYFNIKSIEGSLLKIFEKYLPTLN